MRNISENTFFMHMPCGVNALWDGDYNEISLRNPCLVDVHFWIRMAQLRSDYFFEMEPIGQWLYSCLQFTYTTLLGLMHDIFRSACKLII